MLAFADVVVGKEVHLVGLAIQGAEEGGGGGDVGLGGVDLGDEGDADAVGMAFGGRGTERGDHAQVLQDQLIRDAGVMPVHLGVHGFQVHEEQFARRSDGTDDLRGGEKGGVHGAVEAPPAQFLKQFQGVRGVQQRFAAAERDTAAGVRHDPTLLFHFGHQVVQGPFAAADFHGEGGAGFGTGTAQAARPPGRLDPVRGEHQGAFRTGLHAGGAADAFYFLIESLLAGRPAFRVVAPYAAEGAALQEKGGPDPGAVVDGVTFKVKK